MTNNKTSNVTHSARFKRIESKILASETHLIDNQYSKLVEQIWNILLSGLIYAIKTDSLIDMWRLCKYPVKTYWVELYFHGKNMATITVVFHRKYNTDMRRATLNLAENEELKIDALIDELNLLLKKCELKLIKLDLGRGYTVPGPTSKIGYLVDFINEDFSD